MIWASRLGFRLWSWEVGEREKKEKKEKKKVKYPHICVSESHQPVWGSCLKRKESSDGKYVGVKIWEGKTLCVPLSCYSMTRCASRMKFETQRWNLSWTFGQKLGLRIQEGVGNGGDKNFYVLRVVMRSLSNKCNGHATNISSFVGKKTKNTFGFLRPTAELDFPFFSWGVWGSWSAFRAEWHYTWN